MLDRRVELIGHAADEDLVGTLQTAHVGGRPRRSRTQSVDMRSFPPVERHASAQISPQARVGTLAELSVADTPASRAWWGADWDRTDKALGFQLASTVTTLPIEYLSRLHGWR
jgi:hypothetical protein